jgi:hypothetical protein
MLSIDRSLVSRVRGAACKGADHAGESPVVAITRFGYVAMPDVEDGRPSLAKAQVKVLGAERTVRPIRRASKLRGRSESEHYSVETASTRSGSWITEQPSPSRNGEGQWTPMIVTGVCSWRLLRRIDGGTEGMICDPKQGRSLAREAQGTSLQARPRVDQRLADRVVVAMMLRDNITLAEQRTRGAAMCLRTRGRTRNVRPRVGLTGVPRRVAKAGTKRASNSPTFMVGQVAREEICGRVALKPYWGKPAVRNFRGACGNGSYGQC